MKTIAISFTLKDQDENEILELVKLVAKQAYRENENVILIHGFLPTHIVLEKGFSTKVVDLLHTLFPIQLNLWNEKPLRAEMAQTANNLFADVYFIGQIKEGVLDEFQLYRNYSLVNLFTVTTADGIRPINPNSLMA